MTPNEYQKLAESTSATKTNEGRDFCLDRILHKEIRLLHAAAGLDTESGEFMDELKRVIFYGKPMDETLLKEEIGDILWYCAEALNALGANMEDVMKVNINKLRERYPAQFNETDALNRDLDKERQVLEAGDVGRVEDVLGSDLENMLDPER